MMLRFYKTPRDKICRNKIGKTIPINILQMVLLLWSGIRSAAWHIHIHNTCTNTIIRSRQAKDCLTETIALGVKSVRTRWQTDLAKGSTIDWLIVKHAVCSIIFRCWIFILHLQMFYKLQTYLNIAFHFL